MSLDHVALVFNQYRHLGREDWRVNRFSDHVVSGREYNGNVFVAAKAARAIAKEYTEGRRT